MTIEPSSLPEGDRELTPQSSGELKIERDKREPETQKSTVSQLVNNQKIIELFLVLDAKVSDFVERLQNMSLFQLAILLSKSALLFGVISYLVTIPARRDQHFQNLRQVLYQDVKFEYSEGRIFALQALNKRCVNQPGLTAPKANLQNIKLNKSCHHFFLPINGLLLIMILFPWTYPIQTWKGQIYQDRI